MIVYEIDIVDGPIFKGEYDPPVPIHRERPEPFQLTRDWVQSQVVCSYTLWIVIFKKLTQAFVAECLDQASLPL
jgi:hypothetical protein